MSYTKDQLVNGALEEIGIAAYEFDISAESAESALLRLDAMMMQWDARGIHLSYPIGDPGTTSLTEDSNIPAAAWEAVITNLAIRIAPSYGKTVSIDTKIVAKNALNTLLIASTQPRKMQLNSLPSGAGYKQGNTFTEPIRNTYLEDVDEQVDLGEQ